MVCTSVPHQSLGILAVTISVWPDGFLQFTNAGVGAALGWIHCSVSLGKKRSIQVSHEAEVGVKWT